MFSSNHIFLDVLALNFSIEVETGLQSVTSNFSNIGGLEDKKTLDTLEVNIAGAGFPINNQKVLFSFTPIGSDRPLSHELESLTGTLFPSIPNLLIVHLIF